MFMLYAIPIGVVAGWVRGGSLDDLGWVRIKWAAAAAVGLIAQVILFFGPVAERIGGLGTPIYLGSTLLVLVVVLRNVAIPGLPLVALGTAGNLAAILANGGSMPASPAALASLGKEINPGYSNSAIVADPALWPLTDVFALPPWLPYANVFSIGDVLIGVGVAWAIAAAMAPGVSPHLLPTYSRPGTDER